MPRARGPLHPWRSIAAATQAQAAIGRFGFIKKHGEDLYFAELDGCEVGTKDPASGKLARKGWTIMTNSWRIYKALSLRCSHHERHPVIQGQITSTTAYYPGPMCRKIVNQILKRGLEGHRGADVHAGADSLSGRARSG